MQTSLRAALHVSRAVVRATKTRVPRTAGATVHTAISHRHISPTSTCIMPTVATPSTLQHRKVHNNVYSHVALERDWFPDEVEGPMYRHEASKVTILDSPSSFYDSILTGIQRAQRHISLSTLYLGEGDKSRALVRALCDRIAQVPDLQVHVLLDGHRGTRLMPGGNSSLSLLGPLLQQGGSRVRVSLSQSPPEASLLPPRVNEVPFVYHIKGFIFDDDVLMSGANLSDDYFTNRLDRYWLFRDAPGLSEFYQSLFSIVADMSHHAEYQDDDDGSVGHHSAYHGTTVVDNVRYDALIHGEDYLQEYRQRLSQFLRSHHDDSLANHRDVIKTSCTENDIFVIPTVQYAPAGVHYDINLTSNMLRSWGDSVRVHLCTAYFNLSSPLAQAIVDHTQARVRILAASPKSNGFLGSSGWSGYIPALYRHRLTGFHHYAQSHGAGERVEVEEWEKDGWTFHGKGLWAWESVVGQADDHDPSNRILTTIGSPNFGRRSAERDIESQLVLLIPASSPLGKAARSECREIFAQARAVPSDALQDTGVSSKGMVKMLSSLSSSWL